MAVVPVYGYVKDFAGVPISGVSLRLWFRPNGPTVGDLGLQPASRWVRASLTDANGYFVAQLDNSPGVFYIPVIEYLSSGSHPNAFGFEEWPQVKVFPGPTGGGITDLAPGDLTIHTVLVSVEEPPVGYTGWWLHSGPGDPDDEEETGTGELRRVEGWTA